MAEKTALAGGNTWRIESLNTRIGDEELPRTYVTDAVSEGFIGREEMQDIDDGSEPLE